MLDAYSSIKHQTKAQLYIAGSGLAKDVEQIKNRIKGLGLEHRVILKGKVVGEEKEKLLQNASVVAMPSRFETFGMVALEALSYGKPLVTFAIEGLQWVPSRSIIRAKSFDAQHFGKELARVLVDQNLQKDMRTEALMTAQQYSWEHISKQYREAIRIALQEV